MEELGAQDVGGLHMHSGTFIILSRFLCGQYTSRFLGFLRGLIIEGCQRTEFKLAALLLDAKSDMPILDK